ncbi:MAG: SH3 domain-containing protein [Ginsengibacter sp.]
MSALQDKYKELLDAATSSDVSNLNVSEVNNVLHVSGEAPSGAAKDKLWEIYNKIDPDYRTGDLILDVNVAAGAGTSATVTTDSTSLNIRKGPGTDQPIIGKADHGATVTLLSKANDQWWLIKNEHGDEGYAYAQYLSPQ